jgi:hypothetical protein
MHHPHRNLLLHPARFLLMTAAIAFGIPLGSAAITAATAVATPSRSSIQLGSILAQDSDSDNDNGVSSDQLEKYIAVYRDMQRDRSLTVESAAAKESLSINQFRHLEQKIERDDVAREHVRTELQAAATTSPSAASSAAPAKN